MVKKILEVYKLPLLISLTIAVVLIAVNVFINPVIIILTVCGAFLGTFLLDLDYILYAYFYDPTQPFSITLKSYIAHKDFVNALNHIYYNKSEVKEKSLNSALFQIVLGAAAIFTASSSASLFVKALVISAFANSIYKMTIYFLEHKKTEWFWAFKNVPSDQTIRLYGLCLIAVLAYSISLF